MLAAIGIGLELALLVFVVLRARRLVRRYRSQAGLPAILRLADALEHVGMPRIIARIVTTELVTMSLAVTGWFRRAPRRGFSSHRTHGTLAIHVVLVLLIAVETIALHLLVVRASVIAAWILTGGSIYAAAWLLGDLHALRLGRIRVDD